MNAHAHAENAPRRQAGSLSSVMRDDACVCVCVDGRKLMLVDTCGVLHEKSMRMVISSVSSLISSASFPPKFTNEKKRRLVQRYVRRCI